MSARVTDRLLDLLLSLYPRSFRERYGGEVRASLHGLVASSRRRGRAAAVLAWLGGVADIAAGVLRERLRPQGPWGRRPGEPGHGRLTSGALQDLRLATRQLVRRPLFTLVAAGSLAVGIGATTAVFSVGNALLVKPLPGIANYDRVVDLGRTSRGRGFDTFSYPDFVDIRSEIPALEDAAAYTLGLFSVSGEGEGIRAFGFHVMSSYFALLGTDPAAGRFFTPDEDVGIGEHPVVVLSHRFWTDRLGADPDAVGSTLLVNRLPFTVVGIAAADFQGHMIGMVPDLYLPFSEYPPMNGGRTGFEGRGASFHLGVGLLSEGATIGELDEQLATLAARLAEAYPETNRNRGFRAMPLGPIPGTGRAGVRLFLTALLGMVVLILLVTCTNVAGMLLARTVAREREVAVRVSLGAGTGALLRLLTVETLLLFAVGGGLGVWLGVSVAGLLRPELLPIPFPVRFAIEPDRVVLTSSLLLTLATGLIFGLWPALQATRIEVSETMKGLGAGGRSGRLRLGLVGTQVGLCLVLLASAGLFVRSLQGAASIDVGFEGEGRFVSFLDLSLEGYDEEEGLRFQRSLLESLRALPWVKSASLSSDLPLDLSSAGTSVRPEGWSQEEDAPLLPVDFNRVTDGYFETLGIRLLAGRAFEASDDADAPHVVVVSQRFAEEVWPGETALGRSLRFGARSLDAPTWEVVGVVADTKNQVITEAPKAFVYLPQAQRYSPGIQVSVRSDAALEEVSRGVRDTLLELDPDLALAPVNPLDAYTAIGTLPQRLAAWLTTALGAIALLLSGVGIYGVVSYAVGRQRREIGIRMALGADRRSVIGRFLVGGVRLAVPGLVLGAGLALLAGRAMSALLLDLSPYDPVALGTVSVLLLGVVVISAWIPASRAAGVQPAESLRSE